MIINLFAEYQKKPSIELRNKIALANQKLVAKLANKYSRRTGQSFSDLSQIGFIGLLTAVERFNLSKGYQFSTFADKYIQGEILHYLRDSTSLIKISRAWRELCIKEAKLTEAHIAQNNREPNQIEKRKLLGLSEKEYEEYKLACKAWKPLSLDKPRENISSSWAEAIADPRYSQERTMFEVCHAISQIKDEETRFCMESVYVCDITQKKIAAELKVSESAIFRRMEKGMSLMRVILT